MSGVIKSVGKKISKEETGGEHKDPSRRKKKIPESERSSETTSYYSNSGSETWPLDDVLFCDCCGKGGHTDLNCWYSRCDFCGKRGHLSETCYTYESYLRIRVLEKKLEKLTVSESEQRKMEMTKNAWNEELRKAEEDELRKAEKRKAEKDEKRKTEKIEKKEGSATDRVQKTEIDADTEVKKGEADQIEPEPKKDKAEESFPIENEEDDDLIKMRSDLKKSRKRMQREINRAKEAGDTEAVYMMASNALSWMKERKKRAKKELKETQYEGWQEIIDKIDKIRTNLKEIKSKIRNKEKL